MGRKQRPLEPGPLARAGRSVDKKAGTEPYSLCKSALLERVATTCSLGVAGAGSWRRVYPGASSQVGTHSSIHLRNRTARASDDSRVRRKMMTQ